MEIEKVNIKNWKSLIKPAKLDVKISDDLTHATIIAEPLEKGYGLTLGNSLRRILLSSIRGTKRKFPNVSLSNSFSEVLITRVIF